VETLSISGVSASVETMHITNESRVTSLSQLNVSACTERLYDFILEILLANHRKLAQEVMLLILEVAKSSLGRNPTTTELFMVSSSPSKQIVSHITVYHSCFRPYIGIVYLQYIQPYDAI
jgi:hypothetical protein